MKQIENYDNSPLEKNSSEERLSNTKKAKGYIRMIPQQTKNHLIPRVKHAAGTPLDESPIHYDRSFAAHTF